MDIKQFKKGIHINELYAEFNKQKSFVERYTKRMREDPSDETFQKLKSAKERAAYAEDAINKRKKQMGVNRWEVINDN